MRATEFAYWLQGYFEINGGVTALTEQQAEAVLAKAGQVKAGPGDAEAKAQSFVAYTKGILSPVKKGHADEIYLETATVDIRDELDDLFIHSIDQSYDGDQDNFNDLHGGGKKPPRPTPRC